jgi:hypothetical protein
MRLLQQVFIAGSLILLSTGCASIVSKTSWPVSFQSNPSAATVSIVNKKGVEVFKGKTPTAVRLKSGAGFFSKESYVVTISKDGYETKKTSLECKLNGWYFGNILLGGIIGMLIVDPATGAMYKLDQEDVYLTLKAESSQAQVRSLHILNLKDIPADLQQRLVKLP